MDRVTVIPSLSDNFAYLYGCGCRRAFALDPADGAAVYRALSQEHLELEAILVTHAHCDHTAGIAELRKKTSCHIIGADATIKGIDNLVADNDTFTLGDAHITVLATPGHTNTSVCYLFESNTGRDVFTGDTMFVGGCGRIFDADARTMWQSLQRIARLPDDTRLWPGHDYTIEDYQFALQIEPDNEMVKQRLAEVRIAEYTVPSTITIEKQTNIFLRADEDSVKAALRMPQANEVEVFAELRRRKDVY